MSSHPRIRKAIKWGGAAVTVLLVMVWIGSGWWTWAWTFPSGRFINIIHGSLRIGSAGSALKGATSELRRESPAPNFFPWWFQGGGDWQLSWTVYVPMWVPVSTAVLIAVAGWRLDTLARRRARLNLCPKCNYDRAGIAGNAKCPECGATPKSA